VKVNKYQAKSKKRKILLSRTDYPVKDNGLSGGTPDCPVPHARLSGAPRNSSPTTSSRWHWWREATELSGVTSGLSSVKACNANGYLWCQIQRLGAPDRGTPVTHQTVWCAAESSSFSPTTRNVLGPINTTPTGHSKVWEPKQHTKAYCRHFQVLIHPSA
jgi:hypothetical protein